jgi:hypothetical protein
MAGFPKKVYVSKRSLPAVYNPKKQVPVKKPFVNSPKPASKPSPATSGPEKRQSRASGNWTRRGEVPPQPVTQ